MAAEQEGAERVVRPGVVRPALLVASAAVVATATAAVVVDSTAVTGVDIGSVVARSRWSTASVRGAPHRGPATAGLLATTWSPDSSAAADPPTAPPPDPIGSAVDVTMAPLLPAPSISTSPKAFAIVRLPTWLWINQAAWNSVSIKFGVGGAQVSATAIPTRVLWGMGDGDMVVCPGPGIAFDTTEPADRQGTDCSYVYPFSSAGQPQVEAGSANSGAFDLTATIDWTVTWSVSGGAPQTAGPLQSTRSVPLRVEQIQSIGSVP